MNHENPDDDLIRQQVEAQRRYINALEKQLESNVLKEIRDALNESDQMVQDSIGRSGPYMNPID